MRLFKRYTPSNGKLILPDRAEQKHFQAVKEVNKEIMRLRCAYA